MRCKASILLGRAEDVLSIPVQAVFREGVASFVYVPDGKGFSQRLVRLGRSSELQVEVVDGLGEGDEVLLREPSADEIMVRLPPEVVNPKEDQPARQRGARLPTGAETPAPTAPIAPTAPPATNAPPSSGS
jgi:multidrug efflux pump subunit AcrA (membrane-fusion protein)